MSEEYSDFELIEILWKTKEILAIQQEVTVPAGTPPSPEVLGEGSSETDQQAQDKKSGWSPADAATQQEEQRMATVPESSESLSRGISPGAPADLPTHMPLPRSVPTIIPTPRGETTAPEPKPIVREKGCPVCGRTLDPDVYEGLRAKFVGMTLDDFRGMWQ